MAACDLRWVQRRFPAIAERDGEHCSKFRSDEVQEGTSCGAKQWPAMRLIPIAGAGATTTSSLAPSNLAHSSLRGMPLRFRDLTGGARICECSFQACSSFFPKVGGRVAFRDLRRMHWPVMIPTDCFAIDLPERSFHQVPVTKKPIFVSVRDGIRARLVPRLGHRTAEAMRSCCTTASTVRWSVLQRANGPSCTAEQRRSTVRSN